VSKLSTKAAAALVGLSVILSAAAQLLFRYVMQNVDPGTGISAGHWFVELAALPGFFVVMLALGIAFYSGSMLAWIFALSRFDVSRAYPLLSLSYVLVYVAAVALPGLHETATWSKFIGVMVIVAGVSILSLGEDSTRPARHTDA